VELDEEQPASHYPSLAELETDGVCNFSAPIVTRLSAAWEYDHVRASGSVETAAKLTCSRCLAEFEIPVSSDFTIFYQEAKGVEYAEEEVELSDEELISATYQGDEIDVDPEIAEQVLLEIPFKPLCKESCLGLCTQCGQDLNEGECGCDRNPVNLKMAALQKIKIVK